MKRTLLVAFAALSLGATAPATAQKLDLSTVKCSEFIASGAENISFIMMWLQGYYSDQDAAPIVDFDKMKSDITKIAAYCQKNADNGLITAAEEVLQ